MRLTSNRDSTANVPREEYLLRVFRIPSLRQRVMGCAPLSPPQAGWCLWAAHLRSSWAFRLLTTRGYRCPGYQRELWWRPRRGTPNESEEQRDGKCHGVILQSPLTRSVDPRGNLAGTKNLLQGAHSYQKNNRWRLLCTIPVAHVQPRYTITNNEVVHIDLAPQLQGRWKLY